MRYRSAVVVLLLFLVAPVVASAQSYATQGIEHYFRVEWEAAKGRRGPVVAGYVYNKSGINADRVILGIDTVDGAGQVAATATSQVLGTVPPGNRAYFEIPVREASAAYRVRVLSFDTIARGN